MAGIFNEYPVGEEAPPTLVEVLRRMREGLMRAALAHVELERELKREPTPEEVEDAVRRYLSPMAVLEIGDAIPDLPREDMFKLLEDPLGDATRTARRNLVVVAGVSLFVGLSPKLPSKVPGFDLEFGTAGWLVLAALAAVLSWELLSFWSYYDNDRRRLALANDAVRGLRAEVEEQLGEVEKLLPVVEKAGDAFASATRQSLESALSVTRVRLGHLKGGVRSVRLRRFLDGLAPFIVAGLALAVLACRAFCWFLPASFGWIDPSCR